MQNDESLQLYDAFNEKDPSIIKEVISADDVDYGHTPPGRGVQGALDDFQGGAKSFSDAVFNLDEVISLDDRVFVRWSGSAKHTGELLGFPATQKSFNLQGMSIYRVRDGKIIETRNATDYLMPLIQLGIVVPGAKSAA